MKRKIASTIFLVVLVAGALAGVKTLQIKQLLASAKSFAQPPESVASTVVREEKWQTTLTAIGSIAAAQGVTLTPEMAGTVTEVAFDAGAVVRQGDLLVRLD